MNEHYRDIPAMGYLPDLPSIRDYTVDTSEIDDKLRELNEEPVSVLLNKAGVGQVASGLPSATDLRPWCSPIEDQGNIGSCTAHAGVGW